MSWTRTLKKCRVENLYNKWDSLCSLCSLVEYCEHFARFARSSSIASILLNLLARRTLRALCSFVKLREHANVQFKRYFWRYFLYWYAITKLVTCQMNFKQIKRKQFIFIFQQMQIIYWYYKLFKLRCHFKRNQNAKSKNRRHTHMIDVENYSWNYAIFKLCVENTMRRKLTI